MVRPLRLKLQSNGPLKVQFVGEVGEEEAVDQGGPKQFVGEVGEEDAVDQGGPRQFVGEVGEEDAVDQGGPRQFVGEVGEEEAVDQGGPRQFVGEVEEEAVDQEMPLWFLLEFVFFRHYLSFIFLSVFVRGIPGMDLV